MQRSMVAFTLWLEKPEDRALANLRSMLWRTADDLAGVVIADGHEIGLHPEAGVDYRLARREAIAVLEGTSPAVSRPYIGELLPGWYDEWVIVERERLRSLQLQALERQAELSLAEGNWGEAVITASAAVDIDPLRESTHRILIRATLAQGNIADAIRIYDDYRDTLREQLGLDPSPALAEMVWSDERVAL